MSTGALPAGNNTITIGSTSASGLIWLATQTASTSAALNFTSLITSTYSRYQLILENLLPTANTSLIVQISTDNGATWVTSGYTTGYCYTFPGTIAGGGGAGKSGYEPWATVGTAAHGVSGTMDLVNPNNTQIKNAMWHMALTADNGTWINSIGGGYCTTTTAYNAIRVLFVGTTAVSGTASLFAYAK